MRHIIHRALCLTVFAFAAMALNAQDIVLDKIHYSIDTSTNTAKVTNADDGLEGAVSIPASITYNGSSYSVTEIGGYALSGKTMTTITLPNSLLEIKTNAFRHCPNLTSIVIPNSVETMGEDIFTNCEKLTSVVIPNSVKNIGANLFGNCPSLQSVTLPSSAKDADIFRYCYSEIQELGYAEGCTSIFPTFRYNVSSVKLPSTATIIEADAFNSFENLVSIDIPASVTSIGERAFNQSGLTSVSIPSSVTSIGISAFQESNLTSITIPESVTQIGDYAFYDCKELESVEILGPVSTIESGTFGNCPSLKSISIPESVTTISNSSIGLAEGANFICFAATPPTLGDYAIVDVSKANLYVKKASLELYKAAPIWNEFMQIYAYEDGIACAVPDIDFVNGKIVVTCATEGAKCIRLNWKLTGSTGDTNLDFTPKRILEVEAEVAAEGYQNTTTKKTLVLTDDLPLPGDLDGDGKCTINDIKRLIDKVKE